MKSAVPASAGTMTVLIPWTPKQPANGFPIPISGTRNKFVSTYDMDFTGTTITADVFYDYTIDPMTKLPTEQVEYKAVVSSDFLGDVFLCQDGNTGDILRARMYTPAAQVLDWIDAHPNTTQDCGFIIQSSPFGNFPHNVTSLANGVTLNLTQGGGFGRVVGAILFEPTLAGQ
jgi:hypothetical protein